MIEAVEALNLPLEVLEIDHLGEAYSVKQEDIHQVLQAFHDNGYDFMVDLFGIDTEEHVQVVYILRHHETLEDVHLKLNQAYGSTYTSVWKIYASALMPEREVCEMFGLKLANHPNAKRLVTTDGCPPYLLKETKIRTAEQVQNRDQEIVDTTDLTRVNGSIAAPDSQTKNSVDWKAIEVPVSGGVPSGVTNGGVNGSNDYKVVFTPDTISRAVTGVDGLNTEHMILNMGPQHPSTHGVLRVLLELDGELVVAGEAIIGQLHRGIEKLGESRKYNALGTLLDRGDYCSGIHNELAAALATEKLMDIEVPAKANYIRSLAGELNRIASHCLWFGPSALDAGMMGLFLYLWKDREDILDILEELSGQRMMFNYVRPGGVLYDITPRAAKLSREFAHRFLERLEEHRDYVMSNEIMIKRIKGVGHISREMAVNFGLTGANLRASGGTWDVRKGRTYAAYDELDFEVPIREAGDIYARFEVRIEEMRQAALMILQCLDGMPEGDHMAKMPKSIKPPKGEAYGCVESPRGELGIYLVSNGKTEPYRMRYRPPALYALQAGEAILPDTLIADAVVVLGSLDFVLGEIDR